MTSGGHFDLPAAGELALLRASREASDDDPMVVLDLAPPASGEQAVTHTRGPAR